MATDADQEPHPRAAPPARPAAGAADRAARAHGRLPAGRGARGAGDADPRVRRPEPPCARPARSPSRSSARRCGSTPATSSACSTCSRPTACSCGLRDPRRPAPSPGRADRRGPPAPGAAPGEAAEAAEAGSALAPLDRPSASSCAACSSGSSGHACGPAGAVLSDAARQPPDDPVDRRRLLALFRPYRRRLASVLVLILDLRGARHGLAVPAARRARRRDPPERHRSCWRVLVAGMIAIAVATGALGVAQTLLSNTVGQRVMHDLRAAVYRHLQRLSLAFFTRTRTGEIQSRIANDIGGVQTRRHEHRDLDRLERDHRAGRDGRDVPARLAPRGGRARPAAVLRLAHPPRGRGAAAHHGRAPGPAGRHVVAGRGVAVGLRDPARQDDGPLARAGRALRARVGSARRPRGPLAHGGALADGVGADRASPRCRR